MGKYHCTADLLLYCLDSSHLIKLKETYCWVESKAVKVEVSPGLVVMRGDARSKGCGFKSRHHIFVVKICNVCLKRPEINEKEAGVGTFF